jgi:hypothetical protein
MENLSTSKWKEYQDYTIERFNSTSVEYDPYWHIFIEDILHPELFELVLAEWPDFEAGKCQWAFSKNAPDQSPNRKIYQPNRPDGYQFWKQYYDNMIDNPNIISAAYRLEGIETTPDYVTASIWEDYHGYSVGNHVDHHTIDLAWQTYVY